MEQNMTTNKNKKSRPGQAVNDIALPVYGDVEQRFINHLVYTLSKDHHAATNRDVYHAMALAIRDRLVRRWIRTQSNYYEKNCKRVYYISLEFLIGRLLGNNLLNMGLEEECRNVAKEYGVNFDEMVELERDAGLGNGGLGRLAACFLDSMATMELPAYGYSIRYEFGIFYQNIVNGWQVESPDEWLRYGNAWETGRPDLTFPVKFHGRVVEYKDAKKNLRIDWVDTDDVLAQAYDMPVAGYKNDTVNTLRLWDAYADNEFNLEYFNHGDYVRAVEDRVKTETISKVLYPNDNIFEGKELRLKQEYFLVSATLQDIVRRHLKTGNKITQFSEKNAIQLNDTHPALAIPELMRIFMDEHDLDWDTAWDQCVNTFGYTNHTVMPEALENWPLNLMEYVLPRHMLVIFEINQRFLDFVNQQYPGDMDRLRRMSIIGEGSTKSVRMAHLAIVGSHKVNGVARMHSELIKSGLFKEFYELYPDRFVNKTNGITPRRWLDYCNPGLSGLISEKIGKDWVTDLDQLKKLLPMVEDAEFRKKWAACKLENKKRLGKWIKDKLGVVVDPNSIFDIQVKRIHVYKRHLMNLLRVIHHYNRLKANPNMNVPARTVIFAGKAAPGYFMAKLIIKLINSVGEVVNNDRRIGNKLKVLFLPNYNVSLAEIIIPAADLSEQISTAGTEASGTSNMKFSLNGALTIGTMDGANVEIHEAVGDENIFIFGMSAEEVEQRRSTYNPRFHYESNAELRKVLDQIVDGSFGRTEPELFQPIVDNLLNGDHYMLLEDFASYVRSQDEVSRTYQDQEKWTRMSIINALNMGRFSSDRTIGEYAKDIWGIEPVTNDSAQ